MCSSGRKPCNTQECLPAHSSTSLLSSSVSLGPTSKEASSSRSLLYFESWRFNEEIRALFAETGREEKRLLLSEVRNEAQERKKSGNDFREHHHFDPDELWSLSAIRSSSRKRLSSGTVPKCSDFLKMKIQMMGRVTMLKQLFPIDWLKMNHYRYRL